MRCRRAFTLLEMLVAMAMTAVVAGSLYASMRIAFGARRTAEAALEPLAAVESVFELLGHDLSCAPPPRGILAGVFAGTDGSDGASGLPSDGIDFFTRPPCSLGTAPGIVRVSYGLTDIAGRRAIVRRVTVNLLAPEEQQPEEEIVCDGVLALNFRYFDGADWYDTWDSTAAGDSLPVAVEATIVLGIPGREQGEEFSRTFTLPCSGQMNGAAVIQVQAGGDDERPPATGLAARHAQQTQPGTVLIVAMWIIVVLSGLVLVFARAMRVETAAAANRLAAREAEWIARGALAFVLSQVEGTDGTRRPAEDISCEEVPMGGGWFWLLAPDPDDPTTQRFGIVDEAAKLNLNAATAEMLLALPDMTDECAAAIEDWRSPEATAQPGGAKSEYYMLLNPPYLCKSGPLETIEEILLIKGGTLELLFGADTNRTGALDERERATGLNLTRGIAPFVTVYSTEADAPTAAGLIDINSTDTTDLVRLLQDTVESSRLFSVLERVRRGRPFRNLLDFYARSGLTAEEFSRIAGRLTTGQRGRRTGLVNVATAPREVLACLPGLDSADVDALVAARSAQTADVTNLGWVAAALSAQKAADIGDWVTVRSFQFSADIVAVSRNGRAFRRYRAVVDARTSPPQTLLWQDLTGLGWPLSPNILAEIRAGRRLEEGMISTAGGR